MVYSEPNASAHDLGRQIQTVLSDMFHHGTRYMDFFIVIEKKSLKNLCIRQKYWWRHQRGDLQQSGREVCGWIGGEFLISG